MSESYPRAGASPRINLRLEPAGATAPGLLWAFLFREGVGRRAAQVFAEPPATGEWTWTHFPLGDVRAQHTLRALVRLPEPARELFEQRETRIHIEEAQGWAFGVLPDLERDLSGKPQDVGRLVFALSADELVTARVHALRAVDDLRREVERGERLESPAEAMTQLMSLYVERVEDVFEELNTRLAAIEDYVLGEPQDPADKGLSAIRRAVAKHRRELQGLRGVLARASGARQGRRASLLTSHLAELPAWVEDVDREASGLQERARLLHEDIDTLITSATNRNMRALTVISTLLIPPTLIVGAFGMNLSGIPFSHSSSGFTWAAVLCVGVVAGAVWMLRRMGML
jgi:zinc transporter